MRKKLPPPEPPTPKGGGVRPASAGFEATPDRISPEDYVTQDEILKVLFLQCEITFDSVEMQVMQV